MARIILPKWCPQRRTVRGKRRQKFDGFSWIRFKYEAVPCGHQVGATIDMPQHHSSGMDNGPDITTRKMDAIEDRRFLKYFSRRKHVAGSKVSDFRDTDHQRNLSVSLQRDIRSVDHNMFSQGFLDSSNKNEDRSSMHQNETRNAERCFVDGELVWARTNGHSWWPAQVTNNNIEGGDGSKNTLDGIPVSLFGEKSQVWVDSMKNVSKFDEGYEEKINNSTAGFNEALKEAFTAGGLYLHKPGNKQCRSNSSLKAEGLNDNNTTRPASSDTEDSQEFQHRKGKTLQRACTPDTENCEGTRNESGNTLTRPASTAIEKCEETQHGRGKRKRKPKVPFDEEVLFSIKSFRRTRRLKIMRHLGLIAPSGSPYAPNHHVKMTA